MPNPVNGTSGDDVLYGTYGSDIFYPGANVYGDTIYDPGGDDYYVLTSGLTFIIDAGEPTRRSWRAMSSKISTS